ncbi:MAG: hypothetical protein R3240_11805, partial [Gammaproteobacteria bacterium]|nr:hypothetical protein [Gammaproteobacteria bacterium]
MLAKKLSLSGLFLGVIASSSTYATNGMNLEGYGPIATAMGGASMAVDNGTAAVMNNPATLSLMPQTHRLDVALGMLGPDVSAEIGGMTANSSSTSFFMPAVGWVQKSGALAYGFGIFAQGGMGTEYKSSTWLGGFTGQDARSEVSVGRFMVPLAYDV